MKKIYFLLFWLVLLLQPAKAQLIINEVLYDPSNSGLAGDANGDSVYSQTEDEFIEFLNVGTQALDVSGYQILDDSALNTVVYTIPNGIIIPPNGALVVFGGGKPRGLFGNAIVLADTGEGLSLNNSGEIIIVKNAAGQNILRFDSDALSNNPNESYTRNPDITGLFVQHASVNGKLFSPGTKVNGAPFIQSVDKKVRFKVDMSYYTNTYDSLYVTGNFNAYCNNCIALSDVNKDGVFEAEVLTNVDTLWYKFVTKSGATITPENYEPNATCVQAHQGALYRQAILKVDTLLPAVCYAACNACASQLSLKGVMDFITPALGASGKGIHLQATEDITNLSIYGIGVANNGGGTDGEEYTFPAATIKNGAHILLVRDSLAMLNYLDACKDVFTHVFVDNVGIINQNGDDAIELFRAGNIIETFGNSNEDGTGKEWEYTGAWAYKNQSGTWVYGAINCTDSSETIYDTDCIYPICSEIKVTQIIVSSPASTISTLGGTLQMAAEVLPINAPDKSVTWSVDSTTIASISSNGLLTAKANGKVIVKASANDNSGIFGTKEITITGQSSGFVSLEKLQVVVYPNPVQDKLFIQSTKLPLNYTVTNVLGQTEKTGSIQDACIDLSTIPTGVYFIQLSAEGAMQQIKIVKQ
jgi:hypothetical protein